MDVFTDWLNGQTERVADLVGSLSGSLLGLFAILLGALWNAHLNRRRDSRLRQLEIRATATAIYAELEAISSMLHTNEGRLEIHNSRHRFLMPDISTVTTFYERSADKIVWLPQGVIQHMFETYWLIEEYPGKLRRMGGKVDLITDTPKLKFVEMPPHTVELVRSLNKSVRHRIEQTKSLLQSAMLN